MQEPIEKSVCHDVLREIRAVLDQFAGRVEGFEIVDAVWRRNNGLHGLDRLLVTVR